MEGEAGWPQPFGRTQFDAFSWSLRWGRRDAAWGQGAWPAALCAFTFLLDGQGVRGFHSTFLPTDDVTAWLGVRFHRALFVGVKNAQGPALCWMLGTQGNLRVLPMPCVQGARP